MERHTGTNERYEVFGGKRYTKVGHARTVVAAEQKVEALRRKGMLARREQEMRGHYNIYARRK
jgi:hypothetical protein